MSVTISGSGQTIVQVVHFTLQTLFTTTSSSYVDIGCSVSITPTNANNKILVLYSCQLSASPTNDAWFSVVRNSTPISIGSGGTTNSSGMCRSASYIDAVMQGAAGMYLDSPATTSATTYKLQVATNTTAYVNAPQYNQLGHRVPSSITVMEVAYA